MPVRIAATADAAAIAELSEELGYPVEAAEIGRRLKLLLPSSEQVVLVACDAAGTVVGWVHAAEQVLLESGRRCEILGLIVSSASRRGGIGLQLVQAVEEWAIVQRLPEISVRSNVVRDSSHPFYEKQGYVRVKTQHAYRKALESAITPEAGA
jgi:predicted N-acetyltransferase YhbS